MDCNEKLIKLKKAAAFTSCFLKLMKKQLHLPAVF